MPLEASGDLSASQFCAVAVDLNGRAVLPTAGGAVVGVLQNKPASLGAEASIMVDGVTKMVASAAMGSMAIVSSTSAGQAKAAAAGEYIVGITLTGAAAPGELVSVLQKGTAKF